MSALNGWARDEGQPGMVLLGTAIRSFPSYQDALGSSDVSGNHGAGFASNLCPAILVTGMVKGRFRLADGPCTIEALWKARLGLCVAGMVLPAITGSALPRCFRNMRPHHSGICAQGSAGIRAQVGPECSGKVTEPQAPGCQPLPHRTVIKLLWSLRLRLSPPQGARRYLRSGQAIATRAVQFDRLPLGA